MEMRVVSGFADVAAKALFVGCYCLLVPNLAAANSLSPPEIPSDLASEELEFTKPVVKETGTVSGKSLLATYGLRDVAGGQAGVLFGCYPGGTVVVAFRLNPYGTLNFDWSRANSKREDKISLPIDVEIKFSGKQIWKNQKYTALLHADDISEQFRKSIEGPYLPIPPTQEFIRSGWEYIRLAAKVTTGDRVSVVIKRSDPELSAFFSQCPAGGQGIFRE